MCNNIDIFLGQQIPYKLLRHACSMLWLANILVGYLDCIV